MKRLPTLFSVLIVYSFGCGQSQQNGGSTERTTSDAMEKSTQSKSSARQSPNIDATSTLRVFVDKSGTVTADGQAISLNDLDNRLRTLKNKSGIVYYSRDDVASDPPRQSMQVKELVTKHELPVKFYRDKTFTQPVKIN